MKHELKIVKAPCRCAKCQGAKAPQLELNVLGKLKALATLALTAKPAKAVPQVKPFETDDQIAARLATVARQQLAEMVPPPPDLNAAIRADRAKEKN